jgi:3-methyladenine DNA glycosylase/8-oxoguanine DNA glycosylase
LPEIKTELATPGRYHLKRTMSGSRLGAYDPVTRIAETAVALALRTPEGPATVAAVQRDQTLEIEGWGLGARWLSPHLSGIFGLEDDPSGFTPEPGVVKKLWQQFPGMHLPRFPRVFDRLVRVTLLQLVTWKEACRSWGRLVNELGENAPGPLDVRLPPSADTLKSTPEYALVALGIRPKQVRTLLGAAKHASKIEIAAASGADELAALLRALPGIGPWTISYLLGSALGCPDAVLTGDYNLPHTVAYVLQGEPRASEERMLELLAPFHGNRFRVIRLLWMNGVSAPRRGPRYDAS